MKLKYDFEMVEIGEEIIAVPVGQGADAVHGVLKLNKEGQEIFTLLSEDITEDTINNKIKTKYENDITTIQEYVKTFIETLKKHNMLV